MKCVSLKVWSNAAYMKANDRERMEAFVCEYEGECQHYKNGKCVCENLLFGWIKCPHSRLVRDTGLTKRSKGFGKKASQWRETYKTDIQIENGYICECGDYIFLPYPHLDVYGDKVFPEIKGDHFVEKSLFDVEKIQRLIKWHPRSLMGGVIESFQSEQVPKFKRQLKERFPALYEEYIKAHPEMREEIEKDCINHVGRKAYLNTLNDGAVYIDCHRNRWEKRGEWLVCDSYNTWLAVGRKSRVCMQQIMGDEIIPVVSNNDVSEKTVFVE